MQLGLLKPLVLLSLLSSPCIMAQSATVRSDLQFESTDAKLVQAFDWAKSQALAYAHDGTDPVGPWYEAALPGRNAFCMRDVSHQAAGAAALGLYRENRNMLRRFALSQSKARDWAAFWEIDRTGNPSPADYVSDQDFWYNLPANFDLLDSIVRMWMWTGDSTYLTDPGFQRFFGHTSSDYLTAWSLEPDTIFGRPRIMHRSVADGRFVQARGIPSYTEGREDFNLGTDLLASEYRAFESLQRIAEANQDTRLARNFQTKAQAFSNLIDQKAWSEQDKHFVGFFSADGRTQGSGDQMVLYFRASRNPDHIRAALSYIQSPAHLNSIGIEDETYLAQTFYAYDEKRAAYDRILDLTRPDKKRREYPEVAFSVIGALVNGTMGIEIADDPKTKQPVLRSLSRLPAPADHGALRNLRVRENLIDIEHRGNHETSLTNRSGPGILWQPEFTGSPTLLRANGKPVPHQNASTILGSPQTSAILYVAPGATVVVHAD